MTRLKFFLAVIWSGTSRYCLSTTNGFFGKNKKVFNRHISERPVRLSRYFCLCISVCVFKCSCTFFLSVLSVRCGDRNLSAWRRNICEKYICDAWKILWQWVWVGLKKVRLRCIYKDKIGWNQLHWLHFKLFRQISCSMKALREPWNFA